MQRNKVGHRTGTLFTCMAMLGAVLLPGIFMAGPAVRLLGAEEAKAPAMEQAKMQPGLAEAKAPPVEHPMMKPAQLLA